MSLSLDGLYSGYDDVYGKNSSTEKTEALKDTLSKTDFSSSSEDELLQVCKDFEAYFVEQVFKSMEKMIPKDENEEKSDYLEMFGDTLTQEYAKSATEQGEGLGLAKMLYEQMKRNYNID